MNINTKYQYNNIYPVNTIGENLNKFTHAVGILKGKEFKNPCIQIQHEILLTYAYVNISAKDWILDMQPLMYVPAPAPCLLGLGCQHPEIFKKYQKIVTFDDTNRFVGDSRHNGFNSDFYLTLSGSGVFGVTDPNAKTLGVIEITSGFGGFWIAWTKNKVLSN